MMKTLNSYFNNKRIPLLLLLNVLLIVFVVLEFSILNQGKVTRDIWDAKREASERAGRILRAERADKEQEIKEQKLNEEKEEQDSEE